jgi:hypothetical protein
MNTKVIGIGLLVLLGVGAVAFLGKGKVETEINDKVFTQIKALESKFKGDGTITLKKEDVQCEVTSSINCIIKNIVVDNKLSTTKMDKVIITNIKAIADFDTAIKSLKDNKKVSIKNNIGLEIQGLTMVGKQGIKELQDVKFDKIIINADLDITDNISNNIEASIKTEGVIVTKFDKKQKMPNADISLKNSKSGTTISFSNENFAVKANTKEDLTDFTNTLSIQQKMSDINKINATLSFNKPLLEMEKTFLELVENNGLSPQMLEGIKKQMDMVNKTIANKEVFVPNTRKTFPQYTKMIGQAGFSLKNKDADLEKLLSYIVGDTKLITISLSQKAIEIK